MANQVSSLKSEVLRTLNDFAEISQSPEVAKALKNAKLLSAREYDVEGTSRKALVLCYSYRSFMKDIKPIQTKICNELEKKTKRHVCFVAKRDVYDKHQKRPGQRIRPFSRTLASYQNALLKDIIGNIDIVNRRIIISPSGERVIKIFLNPEDKLRDNIEEKLPTFSTVYSKLISKKVAFEFADYVI